MRIRFPDRKHRTVDQHIGTDGVLTIIHLIRRYVTIIISSWKDLRYLCLIWPVKSIGEGQTLKDYIVAFWRWHGSMRYIYICDLLYIKCLGLKWRSQLYILIPINSGMAAGYLHFKQRIQISWNDKPTISCRIMNQGNCFWVQVHSGILTPIGGR